MTPRPASRAVGVRSSNARACLLYTSTHYGIGKETRLRTRTYGLQVDNTSRFMFGKSTLLSAHYGIEYFTDRASSSRRWNKDVYKRQGFSTVPAPTRQSAGSASRMARMLARCV